MTDAEKKMTQEETKEYYATLVAAVIGGDEKKKKTLDECAIRMLTAMRTAHPTLSDTVLCSFTATNATLLAQLLTVQARDLSDYLEHTFNDYLVVSAVLIGAYDPTSTDMPKAPEPTPAATPVAHDDAPGNYL